MRGHLSNQSGRVLRAQFLTALSTTCVQDFTASFSSHARAETVAPFAHEVRRLVGAFHRSVSILFARVKIRTVRV